MSQLSEAPAYRPVAFLPHAAGHFAAPTVMPSTWTLGDYTLRGTLTADVPAVTELERQCFPDPWPLEKVEAFVTTPHEGHEQFGIVASRGDQLVGYALLATGGGNMSIERLGVMPVERRKRVGTKLAAVAILEGRARNLEFIVTVLRESNVTAQKFFYECGFRAGRIAGPMVNWFGTEDGVAMRRPVVLPIPA